MEGWIIKKHFLDPITASYLRFRSPQENKSSIIGFFLIFIYLLGILPIISDPFSLPFFLSAIFPVAVLQIWAVLYLIDPYKYERSYYLYFGVYGLVNTYVYFLAIQKFMYFNMGATGYWPFVIGIVFFLALILGVNWLHWKALYSGTYHKMQQMKGIPVSGAAIGGSGYVLGQIILSFIYSDSALYTLLIVGISIMSLFTAFCSVHIHKYFFISKNMDLVKQVYPEFGLPKSERYRARKKKQR